MFSWLLNSLLNRILTAQLQSKIWVIFKKSVIIQRILYLLYNSHIILGFIFYKKFIIIFLKYKDLKPVFITYKITHKPTKKKLMTTNSLIYTKKKSSQSFFFYLNSQFFLSSTLAYKHTSSFLLLKIN